MKKSKLIVPRGIKYISNWKEYSLKKFPFCHILNKTVTGCGFTEYCLTNNEINTILVSPRNILLENKKDQLGDSVYFAKNSLFEVVTDYEKDLMNVSESGTAKRLSSSISSLNKGLSSTKKSDEEKLKSELRKKAIVEYKNDIIKYHNNCKLNGERSKILVTYDSFKHVYEALNSIGEFNDFYIVVDEFQSLFVDAAFKPDTENELLNLLGRIDNQKICFVSATPMIDKYLEMLDEFKDLPYYEFDWETAEPNRVRRVDLNVRICKSVKVQAKKIIDKYLAGDFEEILYRNKEGMVEKLQSKEAVIYVNSVSAICSLIKSSKLTPDQCNVLCARTEKNEKDVRRAFGIRIRRSIPTVIGKVPKKGEPHKMFTFCTRTAYLGADFYSTNARTFIFSDANVNCLMVDISLDLPQILGRQRLDENPWKNQAYLYLKTNYTEKSIEELMDNIAVKRSSTEKLISAVKDMKGNERDAVLDVLYRDINRENYKYNYLSMNRYGSSDRYLLINNLVMIADLRAMELQQIDYKDRFTVFNALSDLGNNYSLLSDDVFNYVRNFDSISKFTDKLKYICDMYQNLSEEKFTCFINNIPATYKSYFEIVGPEKLKSVGYRRDKVETLCNSIEKDTLHQLYLEVHQVFKVGDRIKVSDVKKKLQKIFDSVCNGIIAKSTDIERWFEVKSSYISDGGKRHRGIIIVKDLG